jgi:penicillin-binding protein 2
MKRSLWLGLILMLALSACRQTGGGNGDDLPTPQVSTSSTPDVEERVAAYLSAWQAGDFEAMYGMLTTLSRDAIPFEEFQARYTDVATQANLFNIEHEILQTLTNPKSAEVAYRVTLHSAIVGPIVRETAMNLSLENDNWSVAWDERLILPELAGGNTLSMERSTPARGNIYDRNGAALVANTDAFAVGVFPELVPEEEASGMISQLAVLTGIPSAQLAQTIFPDEGIPDFYEPIAEVSADAFNARFENISGFSGIRYTAYSTRLYFDLGAAPNAVGYVGPIPAEQVEDYIPLGYQVDDRVGRIGVEAWGEEYLAGVRGGTLYLISPEGEIVTQIAQSSPQAAASVYTTLDQDLQLAAQAAIQDFNGAIVVLERDTGRVLAMASSPTFNPNWVDLNNYNSEWDTYFPDERGRFFNRATQGQYAPGSIFKVVSFAAALESGIFTPDSTFNCTHEWNGLPGVTLVDWTLEKELPASGLLTLSEGLMRSCNPWFYEVGKNLYEQGFTDIVAEMAAGFGLGQPTGIQAVGEQPGAVEIPSEEGEIGVREAVQQAIGQGTTTITPLQAAVYAAAVGNGGTLYRPQLVERVEATDGSAVLQFEPDEVGELPVSESTLRALQTAMRSVITDPRGTAYNRFLGFTIPIFGKTGTASVEGQDPNAWFIAYTDAQSPSNPDIAIAVLVENIGDGSEFAAPMARRIASQYFFGTNGPLYPWESDYGVLDPTFFEENPEGEEGQEAEDDSGAIQATPVP